MIFDVSRISRELDVLELPFGDANPAVMAYHRVFVQRHANTINCLKSLPRHLKVLELAAAPYGMTAILRKYLF